MSLPSSPTSDCAAAVRYTLGHSAFDLRKRKLDDYSAVGDDSLDFFSSDLTSVRLRRDENLTSTAAVHAPVNGNVVTDHTQSASSSHWSFGSLAKPSPCSSSSATWQRPSELQFFIRLFIGHGIMVFRANFNDTVMSVHERIEELKGIPVVEQRLIYRGKQLQWEKSLADYAIENDSELHLIGRLRSTNHPRAFQLIDELISFVYALVRSNRTSRSQDTACLTRTIDKFFGICPDEVNSDEIHKKSRKDRDACNEDIAGTLELFLESSAPGVLVMLYGSNISENKKLADRTIRYFLSYCSSAVEKSNYRHCAMIALEFCNLLRKFVSVNDGLYVHCRSMLGSFLESVGVCCVEKKGAILLRYVFPFVKELATKLSNNLLNMEPTGADVTDLAVFLIPTCNLLMDRVGPISLSVNMKLSNTSEFYLVSCALELHGIFEELLTQMDKCLLRLEKTSCKKPNVFTEPFPVGACYLAILKVLNDIAKLYKGAEERFWMMLKIRKTVFCALIVKHATRTDDNLWLLQHKEVTNFESRRHLATLLFPDVKEDYEEMHEMLIDRSQLLAESFEYIVNAATDALHGGLFMEFKNEEATGPGVLREWFFLVAQDIFNQQNALFLACPNDRRRFFPNPASSVNHMHLEYYTFSGRVIALALMHKVQLGVVFDRVFFLQLAGKEISLEDIRDADPYMYSSCKQILQMDAEFVDADGLGLTFVREVEQLGSKRVVELCPGGENIAVNSRNREQYVNLLIRHCFVTSMAEQKNHFVKGFADILSEPQRQKLFFQSLELEDLDFMLYGSERPICVQDWKAHTEYNGYKETDPQISWFWKIVEKMSHEQRKVLLFFWTSVKFLPVEGFCGLASKLYIYKSSDPNDRLPSSHTCFFRLCFPPYPSMSSMRDRLSIITQEHVGCSFGTW